MYIFFILIKNNNGDYMNTIWYQPYKTYPTLKNNLTTDILIIGGGLTGILTAYFLKDTNKKITIVEAKHIGQGNTGHATAKVTSQHGLIYHKHSKKKAQLYYQAMQYSLNQYIDLSKKYDFDLEIKDHYIFSKNISELEAEINAYKKLKIPYLFKKYRHNYMIGFKNQLQINPLKLIHCLAKNLNIYENTRIIKIENHSAYTHQYKIKANMIIVATHYPIMKIKGLYPLKLYQQKSAIIAYKNIKPLDNMYLEAYGHLSLRSYGDYTLVVSPSKRTGCTKNLYQEIEEFVATHFPQAIEVKRWINQDCMSLDQIPYIGKYSILSHNLYVATGYNEWGFTSSMLAAKIISDMINGKKNQYQELCKPYRPYPLVPVFKQMSIVLYHFLFTKGKRCPHLGCHLKKIGQHYECPCHGSSFKDTGAIINNPSIKDLHS